MDEQKEDDQQEPTYNSSVPIQDVAFKTYRERWTIEKGGGKGSGRSALAVQHDGDIPAFVSGVNKQLVTSFLLRPVIL